MTVAFLSELARGPEQKRRAKQVMVYKIAFSENLCAMGFRPKLIPSLKTYQTNGASVFLFHLPPSAVESRRGDGRRTACEVLLFHHEDMGIPWEIAKLGIRQGMWGCVKKIEPGLRAYQASRKAGEPLSRSAATAQINTKVSSGYLRSQGARSILADGAEESEQEKPWRGRIPKLLIVGGAVAFACTIDRGLITKAIIFGVARRFAKIRRGL